jgi:low temperature requirement protein LtrA
MSEDHGVLRMRRPHHHNRVTFVELFFDLVFVFAITQLSHTLLEHFTFAEAGATLILLLAIWCTWIYTTWATNWLDPDNIAVRLLLFVLMLAGLILSSSISEAFNGRGLAFAGAYVFLQVSRTSFVVWAFRNLPAQHHNLQRILVWLIFAAIFWIAGGFVHGTARIAFWIVAISLEFLSPLIRFWVPFLGRSEISDWEIEGSHMAERCGLFIIIALGESLLVIGATFSDLEWTATNVASFITSFLGSLLLWWLYFNNTAEAASQTIAKARDSGRLARSTYTYSHLFLVAGIILLAVADEFILAHPTGHTEIETTIALLGGTALYLIGNLLVKWTVWGRVRISHVFGLVALLLLIPAANVLSPLLMNMATTLLLVVLAAWEAYYYRRYPQTHYAPTTVHSEQAQ